MHHEILARRIFTKFYPKHEKIFPSIDHEISFNEGNGVFVFSISLIANCFSEKFQKKLDK